MKLEIWKFLTSVRDSHQCPEFLRSIIDWLRDEIFYPYDL